jgi:hypothetical protein
MWHVDSCPLQEFGAAPQAIVHHGLVCGGRSLLPWAAIGTVSGYRTAHGGRCFVAVRGSQRTPDIHASRPHIRGVNKIILIGNATRDAELRRTQNRKAVSIIRLAPNRAVKDQEEPSTTRSAAGIGWPRPLPSTSRRAILSTSGGGCSGAAIGSTGYRAGRGRDRRRRCPVPRTCTPVQLGEPRAQRRKK